MLSSIIYSAVLTAGVAMVIESTKALLRRNESSIDTVRRTSARYRRLVDINKNYAKMISTGELEPESAIDAYNIAVDNAPALSSRQEVEKKVKESYEFYHEIEKRLCNRITLYQRTK